jgi:ParB family transcriptional regulator, chromosome partitioning protein
MNEERRPARPARGLGRGLSALLGDEHSAAEVEAAEAPRERRAVPVERLHRGRFQPRRNFDPDQLTALAESIRAQGVLQPLLVRPHPEKPGEYEIVAGERRWRAAQQAQLAEVPVLVRDISDREAMENALVENVQRQDLNPIEEARGYNRLIDEFGRTQDVIARATGKSRSHIANALRLLQLPEEVLAMVEDGRLTAGHARPLVGHERALEIARDALRYGMNVRQVENRVRPPSKRPETEESRRLSPGAASAADLRALEREFETLLGMKAAIAEAGEGRGTITLRYANLEQIDDFLRRLR